MIRTVEHHKHYTIGETVGVSLTEPEPTSSAKPHALIPPNCAVQVHTMTPSKSFALVFGILAVGWSALDNGEDDYSLSVVSSSSSALLLANSFSVFIG